MKTKTTLFLFLLFCLLTAAVAKAQRSTLDAVNDSASIYPGIPLTLNLLANDTIPAGDSVKIIMIGAGSSSVVTSTINPGGNVTFLMSQWGYSGNQVKFYKIRDYTLAKESDTASVVLNLRDESFGYLDINNVRARFNSSGLHFFHDSAQYEVPKGSGKSSLFANSLWIGGLDATDSLHFAGERYRQGPSSGNAWTHQDYWAGPVSDTAYYNIYQDTVWNYIWKINRTEILYHRNHCWDPGYVAIHNILTWPGNGNVAMGQAQKLAPFSDRNGNGIYEPYDGDYPEIRGDQALFFIYNDDHGLHAESSGGKLRMEIHGMAYAFDQPDDTAFKNTVFLHYKIINRSQNTYHGTYMGIFADIDLGYSNDDYLGCDVNRGMFYGYNGNPVDGTGQPWAYGANPPIQAVVILAGPKIDPDGFDNPSFQGNSLNGPSFNGSCNIVFYNGTLLKMGYGPNGTDSAMFLVKSDAINGMNFGDGITDNERLGMQRFLYHNNSNSGVPGYMTDPAYAPDYYRFMQGIWRDNSKMIYGGNGHYTAGGYGPDCNFMFPGLTDICNWGTDGQPPNGPKLWTEKTAMNNPQDRRGVSSTGPITFHPGDVQEVDVAFAWARDYQSPDSTLNKLNTVVDSIRRHYIENRAPAGGLFYGINDRDQDKPSKLKIYPNPAKDNIFVEIPSGIDEELNLSLISTLGKTVYLKTFSAKTTLQIGVSGIPAGLYLLHIKTGTHVWVEKMLLMK